MESWFSDVGLVVACLPEVALASGRTRRACQTSEWQCPEEVVVESDLRSQAVLHPVVLLVVPSPTPCATSPSPVRRSHASDVDVVEQ